MEKKTELYPLTLPYSCPYEAPKSENLAENKAPLLIKTNSLKKGQGSIDPTDLDPTISDSSNRSSVESAQTNSESILNNMVLAQQHLNTSLPQLQNANLNPMTLTSTHSSGEYLHFNFIVIVEFFWINHPDLLDKHVGQSTLSGVNRHRFKTAFINLINERLLDVNCSISTGHNWFRKTESQRSKTAPFWSGTYKCIVKSCSNIIYMKISDVVESEDVTLEIVFSFVSTHHKCGPKKKGVKLKKEIKLKLIF